MRYLRFLMAAVIVFAIGAEVSAQTEKAGNLSVQFGNKTVLVPPPDGLQEVIGKYKSVDTVFSAGEPPQNVLLAVYVTDSDRALLDRGETPTMHYYSKISTLKAGRGQHISAELFKQVVDEFTKHAEAYTDPDSPTIKKLIENFERKVSQSSSVATDLELSQPKSLGTFNVGPNVSSILLLSAVKVQAAGKDFNRVILAGASLVHVKNRILFVNSYRTYESEADLETMKDSVTKWTNSILAANAGK